MTAFQPRTNRRAPAAVFTTAAVAAALLSVGAVSPADASPERAMTPAAVAAAAPADSLVAHYDFNTDPRQSNVVTDSSGHGLNATLVNGANAGFSGTDTTGSSALDFTGGAASSTGPYVTLPTGILSGKTDLTVSARVKWGTNGSSWQWLYALGTDTSKYLFSTPSNGDGRLRTALTTNFGGGEAQVTGSAALPASVWRTVTVTLDTAADTLITYLDGAEVGEVTTTASASDLLAANATSAGTIGKSFYGDPLFQGSYDDFAVYSTALTPAQIATLVPAVPTVTTLASSSFELKTSVGTAPALPTTVQASFTDGYARPVAVTWDTVDPSKYAQRGTFTVTGSAVGQAVTANVSVELPGQLTVDLGSDTGAFKGGASGTLYGLYGEGLPNNNIITGAGLATVATKAQDGPQHPGADALEVVKPLADATGGDTYIYMTDIYRGFPYQWPGDTPEAKLNDFKAKIATQVDQVLTLDPKYQSHIVFVPFNEPEGNMFGTGEWSYNGTSWLDNPSDYFAAWDSVYALIKGKMPNARIAGPNTSVLFDQVKGFLQHTVAANTVPDVMTWHELSQPAAIRTNVAKYRTWEADVFAGTTFAGKQLPINLDEYAFNYHTSVPGQMIQWFSAIEETKVDADIAYWNIDGNISDSMVESNRGNGQWWLLNAYSQMTGHTVTVSPPSPNANYTLQGVATLDPAKKQARALFGGASGEANLIFSHVDKATFGSTVHALVQRIDWTGQIGDSASPATVAEQDVQVGSDGTVALNFGKTLPALAESSAYQVILTPGANATSPSVPPTVFSATYEAEDAAHTGSGYSKNGPEGSPADVSKFYTSGNYDVGGLRTGSDVKLNFAVNVPTAGAYDLSVFANSLNTYPLNTDQGPVNVFVTVDGAAEQQIYLPLGYKFVVWDHTDTTVNLTPGAHTITLSAKSLDGTQGTKGDEIIDKIDLSLANPAATGTIYQAENASLSGASTDYTHSGASGSGVAALAAGQSATFWVYSAKDAPGTVKVQTLGGGSASLTVNEQSIGAVSATQDVAVSLSGGINAITLTGTSGTLLLDALTVTPGSTALTSTTYQAEDAALAGTAAVTPLSLATGGKAVTGVGGAPGNGNTLTFPQVTVDRDGTYAVVVRYSNQEQSPATHYNPDPLARPADISVNGAASTRVLFPHTFHQNEFWEMTVPLQLKAGVNTIRFSSEEETSFDGKTYISETEPELLRSQLAPNIDQITVTPMTTAPPVVIPVDTTAPVTTVTSDPANATGTTAKPVKLTFSATDPAGPADQAGGFVSGVASTEYRTAAVAGGAWQAVPAAGVTVSAVGAATLEYRSTDKAGNVETAKSIVVTITKAAPVTVTTTTTSKVSTLLARYSSTVSDTVTVKAPAGSAAVTGALAVYVDGVIVKTVQLTAANTGTVTFALPTVPRGIHVVWVKFTGSTGFVASTSQPSLLIVF